MQEFQRLRVWQDAHALRLAVYRETETFPRNETHILVSQLRRSAGSIGWNIAEGCGRHTNPDFSRFLQIATGSASECHDQLIQARDLGYITVEAFETLSSLLVRIRRQLIRLLQYLRRR